MLLKGENFDIGNDRREILEIDRTEDKINEKYMRGEIRIITEQARYPLDTISAMVQSGKYDLHPEYQRRKRWDLGQKSRLIESFIINVPIPPIFLYEVEYAKYEVMDGLQRLTTIDDFYRGEFALTDLDEWKELNGYTYETLPARVREGIDRRYLSSVVLLNETAKDEDTANFLKQVVFGRLNSGGEKLTAQESRNALYGGKFNDLCIELSQNIYFRKLWGYPLFNEEDKSKLLQDEIYRKMLDVEQVLRFFAYRHLSFLSQVTQEKLLDFYLQNANNYDTELLIQLKAIFEKTVSLIFKIFGEEAFFMPESGTKRTTPTKTVADPLMQSISKVLDKEEELIKNAETLRKNKFEDRDALIIKNKEKNNDLFDGKYNSRNNVEDRVKYFDNYLAKYINK